MERQELLEPESPDVSMSSGGASTSDDETDPYDTYRESEDDEYWDWEPEDLPYTSVKGSVKPEESPDEASRVNERSYDQFKDVFDELDQALDEAPLGGFLARQDLRRLSCASYGGLLSACWFVAHGRTDVAYNVTHYYL